MRKLLLSLFFLLFFITQIHAQNSIITGTVTDKSDGKPLPGVSVKVKGTAIGTQTGPNGKFTLNAPAGAEAIRFTLIGYKPQFVAIKSSANLTISLESDQTALNEVVVTAGYGTGTKVSNLVGSVTTISGKEIANKPSPNVLDALQGRVSGLTILSSSGEPSSTPSVSLHGLGSLGAGSTPLVVLDGIPVDIGTLLSLNPNDIAEISVLKDAASTSIYGSRASNGVISISTKKGSFDAAPTITVSSQYGVSQLAQTKFFNSLMNSQQFESFQVASGQLTQQQLDNNLAALPVKNADTKWYKYYYKNNTPYLQENFNISGGGGKTSYYVSGGYLKDDGLAYRSAYDRYTLRSNVTSTVNDWMQFGLNLSLGYDNRQTNPSGGNSTNRGLAILAAPYYSPIDPSGNPYISIPGWGHYSAAYRASVFLDHNNYTHFNPTAYIQLNPVKGLTLRSQAGMDAFDYRESTIQLPSYLGSPGNGNVNEFFTRGASKTFTNTAEYKFNVASAHHFTTLAGQEYIDGSNQFFSGYTGGQFLDNLLLLSAGPNTKNAQSSNTDYVYNSLFGKLGYDYNDRYFVQGTIRQDNSSRFGIDNRSATFWSAGGTWKAKQEDFLKDVSWLDDLTVRASTGTTGNSDLTGIPGYSNNPSVNYLSLQTVSTIAYGSNSGLAINTPGNPKLSWESQRLSSFGVSSSFFNRVRLELVYYIRQTSNMLISVPFPYTSGFSNVLSNTGTLQNKGFDINLDVDVWKDNAHNAYITPFIVANINHNKVTSLFQGKDFWVVPNTGVSWVVGQQVSFFYPLYKGVNTQTGAPEWYLPNTGADGPKTTRKDPNAVTSNFNTNALQQNTGISQYPWLTGSFGLHGGYEGFTLEVLFNFALGKHLINNDRYFYENPNIFTGYNQTTRVLDYWKKPGDVTRFPDVNNYQFTQFDSSLIENASFMRLKVLTLGYSLPKSLLGSKKVIKGVKVFLDGRNLFTVTKYLGPDPEVDSNLSLGTYPNTKQYSAGIQLTL